MKDVKRFVKKVLILICLLCCIVVVLNFVGIQAGKIYKDGAALVCESKREMVRSGAIHYKKNKMGYAHGKSNYRGNSQRENTNHNKAHIETKNIFRNHLAKNF